MPKRVAASAEMFDPTPEEVEKAERAKPLKRPLCVKCKNFPRISVWETVSHRIADAFKRLDKLMRSPKFGQLSRDTVERLRRSHLLLARASKAQYCVSCVTSTVSFVLDCAEKTQLEMNA